jgi:hypothetical protein
MARFAETTRVPVDRSRAEIEQCLKRYGASAFGYMTEIGRTILIFEAKGRKIKISVNMPKGTTEKENQQARQKWRALLLVIKAKLESVSSEIETFEEAFYANVVLPDGATVYERTHAEVALSYSRGQVQPLLPDYSKGAN